MHPIATAPYIQSGIPASCCRVMEF